MFGLVLYIAVMLTFNFGALFAHVLQHWED